MYECEDCGKGWEVWRHRQQHLDATGHDAKIYYCDSKWCNDTFDDEEDCVNHMEQRGHEDVDDYAFECHCCYDRFDSEEERKDHEYDNHLFCEAHDQFFRNRNNLDMHLRSWKHANERPAGPTCPFCKASHNTASGLVHHLERGSCPRAPTNREVLFREIRRRDPHGVISNRLLEYPSSDSTRTSATDRAFNYQCNAYECYLCHRLFGQLNSLDQHLDSPAHQQKLYHCPKRSCGKEFTTLAGLVNHFESESCGYMRFGAVQNNVGRILDSGRMITG